MLTLYRVENAEVLSCRMLPDIRNSVALFACHQLSSACTPDKSIIMSVKTKINLSLTPTFISYRRQKSVLPLEKLIGGCCKVNNCCLLTDFTKHVWTKGGGLVSNLAVPLPADRFEKVKKKMNTAYLEVTVFLWTMTRSNCRLV
jgi:hypothetical protein